MATTLVDAIADAYDKINDNFADKVRLKRGKDIVVDFLLNKEKAYTIKRDKRLQNVFYIVKPDGKETTYTVNLQKAYLRCNCPDVVDLGIINCKHVVAAMLLNRALDIVEQSKSGKQIGAKRSNQYITVRGEIEQAQERVAKMLLDLLSGESAYSGLRHVITVGEKQYILTVEEK